MEHFKLTNKLRSVLSRPMGDLINSKDLKKSVSKKSTLICVGDIVSIKSFGQGYRPCLIVVDGRAERKKIKEEIKGNFIELKASNPVSKITRESWDSVKEAFCYSKPVRITIKGEEDLLGLPVGFFAPANSFFIYGQRGKGVVVVKNTTRMKKRISKYLRHNFYNTAIIGGSWDKLHAGHKYLLLTAFEFGKKVLIGITTDKFIRTDKKQKLQSYEKRKKELKKFLKRFGLNKRAKIFPLKDAFGKSLKLGDALITGSDTYERALELNKLRSKAKVKPIKIVKIERILAHDKKPLSSTRIRECKIDKDGRTKRISGKIKTNR